MNDHLSKKSGWGKGVAYITIAAVIFLIVSRTWPTTPPIGLSHRPSILGGRVVQVTNTSSETLFCTLQVTNNESNRSDSCSFKVGPGSTQEIGMLEMDWRFEVGEKVRVYAKGYLFPITAILG